MKSSSTQSGTVEATPDAYSASAFGSSGMTAVEMNSVRLIDRLLSFAGVRQSTQLAFRLICEYGDAATVISADSKQLQRSMESETVAWRHANRLFAATREAAKVLGDASLQNRPIISNREELLAYCRTTLGRNPREQLRLLHLDCDNVFIRDDLLAEGTLDRAPIYAREVVRLALEANSGGCILVHNHPGTTATPSATDLKVTLKLAEVLRSVDVELHDHIVVSAYHHSSMREQGLL